MWEISVSEQENHLAVRTHNLTDILWTLTNFFIWFFLCSRKNSLAGFHLRSGSGRIQKFGFGPVHPPKKGAGVGASLWKGPDVYKTIIKVIFPDFHCERANLVVKYLMTMPQHIFFLRTEHRTSKGGLEENFELSEPTFTNENIFSWRTSHSCWHQCSVQFITPIQTGKVASVYTGLPRVEREVSHGPQV